MERFNYKEWIKNPQRKIITRNGEKAVIVGVGYNDNSVIAKIGNQEQKYTENGFFLGESENAEDLFFADDNIVEVGHQEKKIYWRKCKAGYKFPSDAIVIADDERTTDRDPRLVRCAVWDSKYILVEDLKKLPIEK